MNVRLVQMVGWAHEPIACHQVSRVIYENHVKDYIN